MLAEYLGSHGYATAGLVANVGYCSYETGLDRGFTHYEDYTLEKLGFLRTAILVERALGMVLVALTSVCVMEIPALLRTAKNSCSACSSSGFQRDAAAINRAFPELARPTGRNGRPFFVF